VGPAVEAAWAAAPEHAACRHCGLGAASNGAFCCYGCELASEIATEGANHQVRLKATLTFSLLLSMVVMMLSLFLFAEDVYPPDASLLWLRNAYRVAAGVLSTPVVWLLGVPLLRRSVRRLREGRLSMDLLVATAAFAAYGLSVSAILRGRPAVYFDSATSALLLATLGRYLEASARSNASRLIGPTLALASEPVLCGAEGDALAPRSPAAIVRGMRFQCAMERPVPVDGRIVSHPVEVNLAVLTGVAAPVLLSPGEEVPAGAVPLSGALDAIALRSARESTLERLSALALSLRARPSKLQRMADGFAAALTPTVWVVALGAFAWHTPRAGVERGVVTALAVVLSACPCTYGVATPLVLWLALRRALERGVCIRSASTLEDLSRVKAVAFDKTGTLTRPDLVVLGCDLAPGASAAEVAAVVATVEEGSRHPVARALHRYGAELAAPVGARALAPPSDTGWTGTELGWKDRRFVVGRGVEARDAEGRLVLLGSSDWLGEHGVPIEPGSDPERARVLLARGGRLLARFRIGEGSRPEAASALAALRADGIDVVMLTGDSARGASRIAEELGVAVHATLTPEGKVAHLEGMQDVAMVGDGLNDAPALAGAGPSFAMSEGTGLARGVANVTLLRADLRLVPWSLSLARRAMSIARANLVGSTVYNLIFIGLAAAGALRPVWAGVSMLTSSALVLASALRVGSDTRREDSP
jgi:P-type Cu2+ transporter